MAKKIELLHTTYDESGNIESQEVVHPLTSPDCIIMENGKTLDEVMGDGIATPTLTHEGTSFKVGVGDSNIEVVDGDVAGMTLKGQSYQNILPKPTTLIMETDEKEFKINDKIDSNIIIDDNIAEIATVKGKTIVNTVQEESASEYTVLGEDLSGQSITHVKETPTLEGQTLVNLALKEFKSFTASTNETANNPLNKYTLRAFAPDMVQPNKEYYLIMHSKYVSGDESANNIRIVQQKQNEDRTNTWLTERAYLPDANGWFRIRFTTVDECNYISLAMARREDSGVHTSTYIYSSGMLFEYQEGMENWNIPYFEGEKYFESNIKGVTLQGQTLVNTIQEPCKDDYVVLGADDGIEIGAETGGHGTIENTVQGGLNGAVLEGMTLVNLLTGKLTTDRDFIDYFIGQSLKANTVYTAIFQAETEAVELRVGITKSAGTWNSNTMEYKNGYNKVLLTTTVETAYSLRIRHNDGDSKPITVSNVMLIEGDYTNIDVPYFEGMKSVQMPVVKTTGKNLFDLSDNDKLCIYAGGDVKNEDHTQIYQISGSTINVINQSVNADHLGYKLPIKKNIEYLVISGEGLGGTLYYRYFGKDFTSLNGQGQRTKYYSTDSFGKKYVVIEGSEFPQEAEYIFLGIGNGGLSDYTMNNIQIEEGTTATSYEPYQSSTISINDYVLDSTQFEQGTFSESSAAGKPYKETLPTIYMDFRLRSKSLFKISGNTIRGTLNAGYGIFFGFFKDGKYLAKYNSWMDSTSFSVDVPYECNEFCIILRKNISDTINVSEYDLIGLTLEQVVELRAIGDVKDELDLTTGKLTQRVECIDKNYTNWIKNTHISDEKTSYFATKTLVLKPDSMCISNKIPYNTDLYHADTLGCKVGGSLSKALEVRVENEKLDTDDVQGFIKYLTDNDVTFSAIKEQESVKTIDLQVTDQDGNTIPHIQTQPTVTHITASSDYLIPTVTIDNNLTYDTIIKPSTLYTVRFKHNTVNADNPLTVDLGGTVQTVTSTEFTITTPSTLTHNQLVFSGKNNVVSEVQVIEGDVVGTQYPFFEGMNDVQITDMTRNVNLFDIKDTVPGYLGATGKEIKVPDHGNLTSNYIKVKPNTTYAYNHGGFVSDFADYWTGMYFYQDDRGTESNLYTGGTHNRFVYTGKGKQYLNFKFTTPSDCEYIRIGSRGLSYDGAWATLYQLDNFSDSKFIARGKNLLIPSILNPVITNSTQNYAGVNFTYNSDGSFTMSGTFTSNITLHGNADEFIKLLKHGARYRTSEMMLMEVFSLDGNTRWTNDLTFDKNNHIRVSPYYQWNGIIGESINKTYYPQVEIGDSQTSYEPYKGVEVQQDIDSIPLTSDMFEQGNRERGMGFSMQQCPLTSNSARISSKALIPVKPGSNYTVSGINTSVNHIWGDMFDKDGLVCYDSVLDLTGGISSGTGVFVPHDVHYLCIKIKNADESAITPSTLDSMNLILQEVPQEIVLRGIGDVKDELDLTRGEYIQRIGEMVLDGDDSNLVDKYVITGNNKTYVTIKLPNARTGVKSSKWYNKLLKNSESLGAAGTQSQPLSLFLTDDETIRFTFFGGSNKTDLKQEKEMLKKYPITIQYILATPIIHKVNLTNTKVIQSYATETHYETITPSDSLIPNITIPSTLNYDVAIKPSTEYTIRVNTSDNLTVDLGGTTGTLSNGKVTLTTPTTLTHNEVKFSGTGKVKELMVVEGNEIKDNVPFFNGMKNVEMGGIKLVNVCRGMYTWNTSFITLNTNYNQITFTDKGSYGNIHFDETLLKSHTTYTVYFNITENTSTITSPIGVTLSQTNGKETSTYPIISAKQTGIMSFTITTDEVAKTPRFVVKSGSTDSKITIKNIMIIEGDWTHLDEIPFIESEMIIEQPIIRSQGKNLLDPTTMQAQSYNGNTVTKIARGFNIKTSEQSKGWNDNVLFYIDVEPYTEYTYSFLKNVITDPYANKIEQGGTVQWREGYCFIKGVQTNDVRMEGSSPNGVRKYLQFNSGNNTKLYIYHNAITDTGCGVGEYELLDFQLEKGHSSSTPYEPYKHQTLYSNRVIGYEENCYYTYDSGTRVVHGDMHTITADVEGLSIAYVTCGSSNFSFWNKDGVYISGKQFLDSTLSKFDMNGFITVPSNAKYIKYPSSIVYENKPYYTKATVTGELPLRSLPNGVCDTLNLVTGEYVQRVGEAVLDGSEDWTQHTASSLEKTHCFSTKLPYKGSLQYSTLLWTDKISNHSVGWANDAERIWINEFDRVTLHLFKNKCNSMNEFKQYLSQNPITVQYELETPIVRKLGFTTKGNYREQVLDGSETWAMDAIDNDKTVRMTKKTVSPLQNALYDTVLFTDDYHVRAKDESHNTYEYITCIGNGIYINIYQSKVSELSVQGCTQWLSQNPIKVGYITSTQSSESYNNIHKPIFFNNVDVQFLPNNVDVQPKLTYQARTRNSYVMDMMKPNTIYTSRMLQSSNGSTFIDGTVVTMKLNNTFTSPSSLTDKLMITPINRQESMIIEGDVTGKNLPYFKGILSSYHDVDEIELYSVSKNLFDINEVFAQKTLTKPIIENIGVNEYKITKKPTDFSLDGGYDYGQVFSVNVKKGETISFSGYGKGFVNARIFQDYNYFETVQSHGFKDLENYEYFNIQRTAAQDCVFCCRLWMNSSDAYVKNIQVEKSSSATPYIPHAHNTTLIEMPTRLETVKVVRPIMENGAINTGTGASYDDGDALVRNVRTKDYLPVQPGEIIKFYNNGQGRAVNIHYYDINKQFIKYEFYDGTSTRPTVPKDCYFVRMYCGKSACSDIALTRQAYKPIQLNSLPNGVCDEIIMKPNSNKAQLVQRVGKVVLDGSGNYYQQLDKNGNTSFMQIGGLYLPLAKDTHGLLPTHTYCDKLMIGNPYFKEEQGVSSNKSCIGVYQDFVRLCLHELDENEQVYRNYLQQNPITVYYELATPIIHEIQLKGYPHVYEDGTVTLNTDTPHQTLVSYNVNQEQLINTQNETIIRHDQQIDDLYYYIEMYLEEIYQMELFRMKLELSL